ncbi:hypothetical protein SLEP1_g52631 [Rubroshorea leprosula]|uniref:Uncharacterized protein n=1 Tax=Rubroshorea leprosula TaxID=152421 RepID=A0AAV5MAA7_9ROSI|nr:hypothetical protein SLEP1_g52631 [Rubroshorea leprosula]
MKSRPSFSVLNKLYPPEFFFAYSLRSFLSLATGNRSAINLVLLLLCLYTSYPVLRLFSASLAYDLRPAPFLYFFALLPAPHIFNVLTLFCHLICRNFFMAEIATLIFEFIKCVAPPTRSCVDNHRKFKENAEDLRNKWRILEGRKEDLETRLQDEVCSEKQAKKEVVVWLQDIKKINAEIQDVLKRVHSASYFSQARLGKLAREKIDVLDAILQRGNFPEGLVVNKPATSLPIPVEDLEGEDTMKEEILGYLKGNEVPMIGVCGIGGVGKTTIMKHIHNELLLMESRFDKVIWVTVSYPLNVVRLQHEIAKRMNESFPENEDEQSRASRLMQIMGKVKYVLILDDVWQRFTLTDVGILSPTKENGCKIVITSRKVDVCQFLGCEIVKVPPLSEEESLNLFLDKIPDEHEWTENLEKVSLMENEISDIPLNMCPNCPLLTTLMLQRNKALSQIPDCFFANMQGLKCLNLSETSIESLPHSICNLENLTTLLLQYCEQLKHVPCLAKLKALKKLDMFKAGIDVVPEGIDMLVNLQYLDLRCPKLVELSTQRLGNLSHLRHLTVHSNSTTLKIKGEEVRGLKKLETFQAQLYDLQDLNNYVKSNHFKRLSYYQLVVGQVEYGFDASIYFSKQISLGECEIGGEDSVVLPDNVEDLWIYRCRKFRSLSDIGSLQKITKLRTCYVIDCEEIECVVDMVTSSSSFINNLEGLWLDELPNLSVVANVKGVKATSPHIFSNLKRLSMMKCSRMKRLFPIELLQGLQNLQEIRVDYCQQMEEIIGWEGEEENHTADATTTTAFTLPKLEELDLRNLPELKRICPTRGVMVCGSLQQLIVSECPKLRRIPLVGNVRPSLPAALKSISINPKELWESLEWEDPNAKNVLQPSVHFPTY